MFNMTIYEHMYTRTTKNIFAILKNLSIFIICNNLSKRNIATPYIIIIHLFSIFSHFIYVALALDNLFFHFFV